MKENKEISVIFGPPGVGKTTLVENLLPGAKEGTTVLLNDIGYAEFEKKRFGVNSEKIKTIQAGCIGCTSKKEFKTAIQSTLASDTPGVIVEPTGVIDPKEVIDGLNEMREAGSRFATHYYSVWSLDRKDNAANKNFQPFNDNLRVFANEGGTLIYNLKGRVKPERRSNPKFYSYLHAKTRQLLPNVPHIEIGQPKGDFIPVKITSKNESAETLRHSHRNTFRFGHNTGHQSLFDHHHSGDDIKGGAKAGGIMVKDLTMEQLKKVLASTDQAGFMRLKGVLPGADGKNRRFSYVNGRLEENITEQSENSGQLTYMMQTENQVYKELLMRMSDISDGEVSQPTPEAQLLYIHNALPLYKKAPLISNGRLVPLVPDADAARKQLLYGPFSEWYRHNEPDLVRKALILQIIRLSAADSKIRQNPQCSLPDDRRTVYANLAWISWLGMKAEKGEESNYSAVGIIIAQEKKIFNKLKKMGIARSANIAIMSIFNELGQVQGRQRKILLEQVFDKTGNGDFQPEEVRYAMEWGLYTGEITPEQTFSMGKAFHKLSIKKREDEYAKRWQGFIYAFSPQAVNKS